MLKVLLVVVMLALAAFGVSQILTSEQGSQSATTPSAPIASRIQKCSSMPQSGTIRFDDPGFQQHAQPSETGTALLHNKLLSPIMLTLLDENGIQRIARIFLAAKEQVQLPLPAGQYRVQVVTGEHWCNQEVGFSDAMQAEQTMHIKPGLTSMLSTTVRQVGSIAINSKFLAPPPPVQQKVTMKLQAAADGHYYLPGNIQGVSVLFAIDTGATLTALPASYLKQLSVPACHEQVITTAGGTMQACTAMLDQVQLGALNMEHVQVMFIETLNIPLLGMNVLSNFKLEQQHGTLIIEAIK